MGAAAERDAGQRAGVTTDERAGLKRFPHESLEPKRANEIQRKASALFVQAYADRSDGTFIDPHHATHGVEPICEVLPDAESSHFRCKAKQRDPACRSARRQRDDALRRSARCLQPSTGRATMPRPRRLAHVNDLLVIPARFTRGDNMSRGYVAERPTQW